MQFSEKLSRLRKARGISQEELAETFGVSRQSVAKWESGESFPEIEKLVAISRRFATSVDSLVKDEEPCSASGCGDAPVADSGTIAFLLRAKRATYAGHGAEVSPSRPASHDLAYREGELSYYDTYLGGERFAGEEAIWKNEVPFWSMNYVGRVLDGRFSGDFLKDALAHVPPDIPYRGPRFWQNGDYRYYCRVEGDFSWYTGTEEIYAGSDLVYECRFHGGLVR
jgi:transcriptional regulator with XRE-family HTH domain